MYGISGPHYFQVKYWSKQFRGGRGSFHDDPRSGRPVEARTEETIGLVDD